MAGSIVVAVRQALMDGFGAALGDHAVEVSYGYQGAATTRRREQVFTNRARAVHSNAALKSGRNLRNERVDFDVVILIEAPGDKPEDADDRAMQIGQSFEEFVADHKNNELGVPGLQWIAVTGFELLNKFKDNASLSELTYTVTFDARLT